MIRLPQKDGANVEEEKKMASFMVQQTFIAFIVTCGILRACKYSFTLCYNVL